jgi:GT2 family glycosyltransferase
MVFRPRRVIATLIERFHYPRLGPGMLWEAARNEVQARGGSVRMSTDVVAVQHDGERVTSVLARSADGREEPLPVEHLVTSMPLTELVARLSPPAPPEVREAAATLRYRDFLTVCLVVNRPDLFPDNWIYVHDPEVQVGRVQNFGNWSPDMVPEPGRSSLGLEYFCQQGDALWNTPDEELTALGARELEHLGLASADEVVDSCVFRVPRSYPVYDASYRASLERVRAFIDGFDNLRTIGRNGLHRYNNQDHSMLTGMLAVRSLLRGERHDVWAVNTEGAYLEEVQVEEAVAPTIPPSGDAARPFSWVPKPRASVVIPVRDDARNLAHCLDAIARSGMAGLEVIVVDDASQDDSAEVATRAGARLLRLDRGMGPGPARNQGAAAARGPVLLFVDADVRVHSDALRRLVEHIERGDADAAFGSYDDRPAATDFVSQWKNLSHRWVHQQGREAASTFWSGLGAVRRDTFTACGGYDQSWGVEDIELGVRLRREGHTVLLDKHVQGTHLKRWTLRNLIRTDIFLRGIPWTRLILHERSLPSDLNLAPSQRLAALLALLASAALLGALVLPPLPSLAVSLTATVGVAALNVSLLRWFTRVRGAWFALRAIPMQLLYYHYSVLAFGLGVVSHLLDRRRAAAAVSNPAGGDAE